jgi:hypothetical protein
VPQPRPTPCPPAGTNGGVLRGRRLVTCLRAIRRQKLLHDLHRRADWAMEARTTPTVAGWIATDGSRPAPR